MWLAAFKDKEQKIKIAIRTEWKRIENKQKIMKIRCKEKEKMG